MRFLNLEEREHLSARQRNILRRTRKFDLSAKVRRFEIAMKAYNMKTTELRNMTNRDMRQVIREDLRFNSLITFLTNEEKSLLREAEKLRKLHTQLVENPKVTDFGEESDPDSEEDNKDPWNQSSFFSFMPKPIETMNNNTSENNVNNNNNNMLTGFNEETEVQNEDMANEEEESNESNNEINTLSQEQNDDYINLNIIEEFENALMDQSNDEEYQQIDAQMLTQEINNEIHNEDMDVFKSNPE